MPRITKDYQGSRRTSHTLWCIIIHYEKFNLVTCQAQVGLPDVRGQSDFVICEFMSDFCKSRRAKLFGNMHGATLTLLSYSWYCWQASKGALVRWWASLKILRFNSSSQKLNLHMWVSDVSKVNSAHFFVGMIPCGPLQTFLSLLRLPCGTSHTVHTRRIQMICRWFVGIS